MNIADLLSPDRVLVIEQKMDKGSLLRAMADFAAGILKINATELFGELLKREELGSTGMGSGVAIPHARLPEISHPLGVLGLLQRPIDFDAVDDEPVDVVFMLAMPTNQSALAALTGIARVLRQQDVVNAIRRAGHQAEICRILSTAE